MLLSTRSARDVVFTAGSLRPLHNKNSVLATVIALWPPLQATQQGRSLFSSRAIMVFILTAK